MLGSNRRSCLVGTRQQFTGGEAAQDWRCRTHRLLGGESGKRLSYDVDQEERQQLEVRSAALFSLTPILTEQSRPGRRGRAEFLGGLGVAWQVLAQVAPVESDGAQP